MPKLTNRTIKALKTTVRDVIHWDSELAGFGLRVKPSGQRSYLIQYRAKGRTRRVTFGPHGVLAPEQARERARKLLASVRDGHDPAEARKQARDADTVAELGKRYLDTYAEIHKKPGSLYNDRLFLDRFIGPALGKRKVADVTTAEVQRLHSSLHETPYQANRVLALLSKMMNLAEKWGLRTPGTNPCRQVDRYKEHKRQRFLMGEELTRLGGVLAAVVRERVELPGVVPAIRLLLFTGARLSEILTLRWEYVDLERQCLHLPDSKTGAKVIYLNPGAMAVLAGIPRDDSPWVIRGRKSDKHLVNIQKPWRRIRKRAELPDLRLHDLRHTFASVGAATGSSLIVIGALLGHTQPNTTARYTHLVADPLKDAANAIGSRLQALLTPAGEPADNVVELKGRAAR